MYKSCQPILGRDTVFILPSSAAAQSNKEYKSKELLKHIEKTQKLFEMCSSLPTQEDVFAFRSPCCTIEEIDDYSKYVASKIHLTLYQDTIDRISQEQYMLGNQYYNFNRPCDTIGGIDKYDIIKYGRKDSLAAFIYTSFEYTDFFFTGSTLWIAFSKDNAQTWEHYFTGLYQEQPIDLKWYSKLPLFRDNKTIQIEGTLMRQTELAAHPGILDKYELAKDGIVIVFDMDVISSDSDGDGLTDIVEAKFRTNPNNKDTNGNGISDNLDTNPCNDIPRTEQTAIYETIINKWFAPYDWEELERVDALPDSLRHTEFQKQLEWQHIEPYEPNIAQANSSTKTILIVTDDNSIKAIQPKYATTIILSAEDYKKSSDAVFKTELEMMTVTPMCRVNGKKDMYLIDVNYLTSGETYLVQKTKNGWRIKIISMRSS